MSTISGNESLWAEDIPRNCILKRRPYKVILGGTRAKHSVKLFLLEDHASTVASNRTGI